MFRLLRRLFWLLCIAALAIAASLAWYAFTPMASSAAYPQSFDVQRGVGLRSLAADLAGQGVLTRPWSFTLIARLQGAERNIKAGSYALDGPVTPLALLRKLTAGETELARLTVVEGWSFREMRAAVNAQPDLRHDTAALSDRDLLAALGVGGHPEGRFFPDTYYFDKGSSDLALYRRAHAALRQRLLQAWEQRAEGLPYASMDEALVMASIVEKETGAPEERPMIAAVFINRLRIGMRLQTDPTVIYGLGSRFDGNLRRRDLEADTPWNTYTRAGLPPTPIALPGEAALRAATHPADSRALYFVAKGNGRHEFSANLSDHNRAVARYQLRH